jgi:hypothetical protein
MWPNVLMDSDAQQRATPLRDVKAETAGVLERFQALPLLQPDPESTFA